MNYLGSHTRPDFVSLMLTVLIKVIEMCRIEYRMLKYLIGTMNYALSYNDAGGLMTFEFIALG